MIEQMEEAGAIMKVTEKSRVLVDIKDNISDATLPTSSLQIFRSRIRITPEYCCSVAEGLFHSFRTSD